MFSSKTAVVVQLPKLEMELTDDSLCPNWQLLIQVSALDSLDVLQLLWWANWIKHKFPLWGYN